jgi:hypothetical protein
MDILPKKISLQLDKKEIKTLEQLKNKHAKLSEKMINAQRAYTYEARICYKNKSKCKEDKKLRKLADKGFKYGYETMMAKEALTKYMNNLIKRYKK